MVWRRLRLTNGIIEPGTVSQVRFLGCPNEVWFCLVWLESELIKGSSFLHLTFTFLLSSLASIRLTALRLCGVRSREMKIEEGELPGVQCFY